MKYYKLLSVSVLFSSFCFGQQYFELNDASKNYNLRIKVEKCEGGECGGKGEVVLFNKKNTTKVQTLVSDDLNFYLNENQQPTSNIIELYEDQSPVIFDDFNFDGTEDIAVRNGNQSSYGGPSYDVYVYHTTKKQFVPSSELTELAYDNLGMFRTDQKRKRIITFAKSGCCWHLTTEYTVVPRKGLVKIFEKEEDAMGGEGTLKVITREKINNKWVEKMKVYPIDQYYEQ
ncbi:hypothetical protein [Chryseobacterium sp.]|uniref:XAC2610-related protein n=1 Tax=Chryseobacterium sp. TaxID=1871047 RepID=UPI0025B93454|nr:hypothetical protein [Chryseobacterium sp.]